jgi:spore coat polysaccharide biosynthesis protein SpsF
MKTGFLVTARLKSTRLPLKLLLEVEGRPIFSHMIDRLKLSRRVDQIIICTSTNAQDDPLEAIAATEGIACFRGDEDDVVKRLSDAATAFELDYILSITADCPFSDPQYADSIVETYLSSQADFIRALDLPHGAFSYGIKPAAFHKVLEIKDETDTEVWGRYFTDTDLFTVYDLPIENPLHRQPELRMTLDYPEDLEFFKSVFAALYAPGQVFSLDEILHFLQAHPEVVEINRHRETDYLKRWSKQSWIKLKPRYSINRAAVIGAGSIGQRHIRNLRALGINNILALRSGHGPQNMPETLAEVTQTKDWRELVDFKPDIAIVSNPTSLHVETIKSCLPHVRGIFIEKPLAARLDGVAEILEEIRRQKVVSFVGYNLQFHPAVKVIQEMLESDRLGTPLSFQAQVGQWIGDWHPDEDYRTSYVARRDLGGGVSLTLSHEIHLAAALLGPAQGIYCLLTPSDRLNLDVDVLSDLMIQHLSGAISQIHLDMIQRPAHRQGTISCEQGWISYDLIAKTVLMQTQDQTESVSVWSDANYDSNQSYLDELQTFLNFVREGRVRHEHDAWRGARSLAIIAAAFRSAADRCFSTIKAAEFS